MPLPTLFVSHGPPTLIIEDVPSAEFLRGLGATLARPEAVLCVSAHWETTGPAVGAVAAPETIYDFYGFPAALYRLRYAAPGAPELARRTAALLDDAGIGCALDDARGLDHGAWAPMMMIYPDADIPVTQLSIQRHGDAAHHLALGRAIAALRAAGAAARGRRLHTSFLDATLAMTAFEFS